VTLTADYFASAGHRIGLVRRVNATRFGCHTRVLYSTHDKFSELASTAQSQNAVLTYEELRSAGLSRAQIAHRVKKGELIRHPGRVFLIAGAPNTVEQRTRAAALAAAQQLRVDGGAIGAASHRSAARLYRYRTVDVEVDASVRYPRKMTIPGVRVVRSRDLLASDITLVDDIPVTTPERTICDLGLIFPEHEVMRILRHAIATGHVDRRELLRIRKRVSRSGRDGAGISGRCIEALPDMAELAESGLEVLFLEICEQFGLPKPQLQLPVVVNGRRYRLDFAYPAQKVFVEIDGSGHGDPIQISNDGGRQNDLVANGWRPVRFGHEMLRDQPEVCAARVRAVLDSPRPIL